MLTPRLHYAHKNLQVLVRFLNVAIALNCDVFDSKVPHVVVYNIEGGRWSRSGRAPRGKSNLPSHEEHQLARPSSAIPFIRTFPPIFSCEKSRGRHVNDHLNTLSYSISIFSFSSDGQTFFFIYKRNFYKEKNACAIGWKIAGRVGSVATRFRFGSPPWQGSCSVSITLSLFVMFRQLWIANCFVPSQVSAWVGFILDPGLYSRSMITW
jgi:hypothetical protein